MDGTTFGIPDAHPDWWDLGGLVGICELDSVLSEGFKQKCPFDIEDFIAQFQTEEAKGLARQVWAYFRTDGPKTEAVEMLLNTWSGAALRSLKC